MGIIKNNRLFPRYIGAFKTPSHGVKIYKGAAVIQGVFAWIFGKAKLVSIHDQNHGQIRFFYNVTSMNKFMSQTGSFYNSKNIEKYILEKMKEIKKRERSQLYKKINHFSKKEI